MATILIGTLVMTSITTPAAFARQDTLAVESQSLVVEAPDGPDGIPTYGPNQSVTITGGVHYIKSGCSKGVNDNPRIMISDSNIQLLRGGQQVTTTSVSAFGNLLLGLPLGITGPTGPLGSGLYTVVYDECKDGEFTPGEDARFVDAFRVVVPSDAPIIDLGATKRNSKKVADTIASARTATDLYSQLGDVISSLDAIDPGAASQIKQVDELVSLLGSAQLQKRVAGYKNPLRLPGLPASLDPLLQQVQQNSQLIANDPPDRAFDQITTATPSAVESVAGSTPYDGAESVAASSAAATAALELALLHAVERYQGAAEAKNGFWATVHAREIDQLARTAAASMRSLRAALGGLAAAAAALPPIDPAVAVALRAAKAGLNADQRRSLRNNGFSASEIAAFEGIAAGLDPAVDAAVVRARTDAVGAALDGAATALTTLADDAARAATSLARSPNTGPTPPALSAGGPYTVATGGTVPLAATATGGTGIAALAWDLDGDGIFDDATGATPGFTAAAPGSVLVAVQAVDSAGQRAVAQGIVTVTGSAAPPAATPPASVRIVAVGATLNLGVRTGQPVQWFVDGIPSATGPAFGYTPKRLADAGVHVVSALVGAPGAARSVLRWTVVVRAADADADGWRANADCNDAVAGIHPGQPEVPGNGLDDDCDPLTADGGTPTGSSLSYPDFSSVSGLALNGAEQVGKALRLAVAGGGPPRSVWATQPVNPAASFSSTFDVSMTNSNNPADGIVFALQSAPAGTGALGGTGGELGIATVLPSVGVEFDTYHNVYDPNANHVAVDVDGAIDRPVAIADSPIPLFGAPFTARVDYDATTTELTVSVGPRGSVPAAPLITTKVDIAATLGTAHPAYAGFTGSTGAASEDTDLLSWRFDTPRGGGPAAPAPTTPGLDLATTAGTAVTGTLTATTAAGVVPTYSVTEQPRHGTATTVRDRLTYTPEPGFVGADTLTYTVAAGGAASAPAVVHVQVGPSPAAPAIAPIAPVSARTTPVTREISASAPGATSLTLTAANLPAAARFQDLGNGRGLLTVDPAGVAPGTTTATIIALSDGGPATAPVRITIAGNRAPTVSVAHATTRYQQAVTLIATASDPDKDALTYSVRTPAAHGTVTNSGARYTYTPAAGYSGPDGFVLSVSDGTTTTSAAGVIVVGAAPGGTPTTPPAAPLTCHGSAPTITSNARIVAGTPGADVIVGGPANQRFDGGGGADTICGGGGNDTLNGGGGNDYLDGEAGMDIVIGNVGDDVEHGGDARDKVGGTSNDPGVDRLFGDGAAPDQCFGSTATDVFDASCESRS